MRLLLDTSAFLWLISGSDRLPAPTRALLREPEHDVWLSVISGWEIVVKHQIGRLPLPGPVAPYVAAQRERHAIGSLGLDEASVSHLAKLPSVHRDPFDRMLVCQAIEHELTIVTGDDVVRQYPIKTIW